MCVCLCYIFTFSLLNSFRVVNFGVCVYSKMPVLLIFCKKKVLPFSIQFWKVHLNLERWFKLGIESETVLQFVFLKFCFSFRFLFDLISFLFTTRNEISSRNNSNIALWLFIKLCFSIVEIPSNWAINFTIVSNLRHQRKKTKQNAVNTQKYSIGK